VAAPAGASGFELAAISCPAADSCTAVGEAYTSGSTPAQANLAEYWNGSTWAIQATPNPAGATETDLSGVSCTSPVSCTAVGYYSGSVLSQSTDLAEYWDGSTWAIQATPSPAGATITDLSGVSCTSSASCTAVGVYVPASGLNMPLALSWNGSTWAIQATPSPAGGAVLSAVSCAAADRCTAAGSLAEYWNGSRWTRQRTAQPLTRASFQAISCAAAHACAAVGFSFIKGHTRGRDFLPLAEQD
jgi:hypothetical protein